MDGYETMPPALPNIVRRRRQFENLGMAEIIRAKAWLERMFIYLIKRHDLFPLAGLADICARVPGSVARDEKLRTQALLDLEEAAVHGELGRVFWLPQPPQSDATRSAQITWLSRYVLVPLNSHIMGMRAWGHPIVTDLYAPRAEAAAWLREMGIPVPARLATGPVTIEGELVPTMAAIAGTDEEVVLESGTPGRPPKSIHLIEQELRRRAEDDRLEPSLAEQARQLHQWLITNHPKAPPPTSGTIENRIRAEYRRLKGKPTKL